MEAIAASLMIAIAGFVSIPLLDGLQLVAVVRRQPTGRSET